MHIRAFPSLALLRAAVAFLLIVPFAACAKELTRAEARRQLVAKRAYPEVVRSYIRLPVGTYWECVPRWTLERKDVQRAIAEGLLTVRITGKSREDSVCFRSGYRRYEVVAALTAAGQKLAARVDESRFKDDPGYVHFRACEIEFGDVTRIAFSEDRSVAWVEYTEKPVRLTTWPDDTGGARCVDGKTRTTRARFRRYDDGWRLISK